MSAVALFAFMLVAHRAAYGQNGNQPVTVTDLLRVQQLGDVALSPDGRQVLYTVRSIVSVDGESDQRDKYEYRTHLHLADPLRPDGNRQLTRGEFSASDAAWHPDGDRIAFVRTVDGTPQIFILPLLGGEAYPLTNIESGATRPRWSPDGSMLLFASSLTARQIRDRTHEDAAWPLERSGRGRGDSEDVKPNPNGSISEIRAWLDENAGEGGPRVFHRLNLHGELDLEDAPKYMHWFVIEVDSALAEPVMITRGYYNFEGGEWMPDGSRVIVSGNMVTDVHPDRVWATSLYSAAADGSGLMPFFSMDGHSVSAPAVSPDGSSFAFVASRMDQAGYAQNEIGVVTLADSLSARLLTLGFDRSASAPVWSPDGWHLYFTAASEGGVPLYRVAAFDVTTAPRESTSDTDTTLAAADSLSAASDSVAAADNVAGPTVERLTSLDRGIRSFDVGSATVFYVATEIANPYELYIANSPFSTDRRLTSHNAEWIAEKRLSFPEPHVLQRDSLEVQYWVMKPTFFDSSRTYPLLLEIHGGPSAMWGPGEASMWHEFQFFASRGYAVIFSNPRGSGGYGYDFKRANYQDWGEGPAGDVLAVATEAARLPWIDEDRQVVTGGSYAGYLTAWIVAHDHRFKAAVAQRGVYDLGTFLGEGNAWRLVPTHFGGYPWEREIDTTAQSVRADREAYVEEAPIDTTGSDSLVHVTPMPEDIEVATQDTLLSETTIEVPEPVSQILLRNSPLTYVDQIRTPLLIMHADQDLRTGVIQSEVLYKSLKILDRPVEYVRYPNSGHELSRSGDPHLRMDRILRIYEFMERFIR